MAYHALDGTITYSGTPFDDSLPTQNTERLAAFVHDNLDAMAGGGLWYLEDVRLGIYRTKIQDHASSWIEIVFDYAEEAIQQHRAGDPVTLTKPTSGMLPIWGDVASSITHNKLAEVWIDCYKKLFQIYYMWQTEEDPLLVKEYIRDLLNSWPLLDTQINLSDETGQAFRVFPAWNNIE